jgi:adenine-specific DNA-methyltransferase
LTLQRSSGTVAGLSRSIANARLDLNPHQVEAALFAVRSPLSRGAILADEVGLGKTIEAGIVIAQRWAERRRRILLIVPASLRKQWQQELAEKFSLNATILEGKSFNEARRAGRANPFDSPDALILCSYNFAASKADEVQRVRWDLVIVDEAHRLRNVYKPTNRIARAITGATADAPKLLLTATPLQNSLMELFGLVSVIDPHVFGDASSFRDRFVRATDEKGRNRELKRRLEMVATRTLRKQVLEYIRFTQRIPITQDFTPSDQEQRLYELVSDYLQRERLAALPASQRGLMTLVLRKLLASSTFAIAGTLRALTQRLEGLQAAAASDLVDEDDFDAWDELQDEWGEDGEPKPIPDLTLLRAELRDLEAYARLAEGIRHNAKGDALLSVLESALDRAVELGAKRKAVIFTESRRTQQYLFDLLSRSGYDGQMVLINGSNSDPHSRDIYERWVERHRGTAAASGSRSADTKAALVEEFRDRATLLLATESAAEGVNLQFCSLVVNYDLPWNPQRIEQRIGRCHRYGQKHDVVVVNFLNRRNAADQRVFELLAEKFQLFHGVFGASDEVLGVLESGVDIEKRIAEVYQTCRTGAEIQTAFDALQAELDVEIAARMDDTDGRYSITSTRKYTRACVFTANKLWLLSISGSSGCLRSQGRSLTVMPRGTETSLDFCTMGPWPLLALITWTGGRPRSETISSTGPITLWRRL